MQKVVAIIDDDAVIAGMYQFKLEKAGYKVLLAQNGQVGLEMITAEHPDLLLLDIRMPIMTGDEMLEKLRQTDWGSSIRVIILTNISRDEAPSKLRFLAVDRYIVKAHTTPSQVLEVVNSVLVA